MTGQQRTVVVTGSSGVIGDALVQAFAARSWRVAGFDARPGAGAGVHHVDVDLRRPEEVSAAFDAVRARWGGVDVLVNNAGHYLGTDFLDTSPEQYAAVMDSNVLSAFLCSQEFARRAIADGRPGAVVNVASVSGRTGSVDCAYGASKGAMIALTRSTGLALAQYDIRVNCVAPGVVASEMADRIPADRRSRYLDQVPLRRFGRPAEIAAAVAFLATDDSSYMTRAVLDVNGGLW